jgi:hypothetical protein
MFGFEGQGLVLSRPFFEQPKHNHIPRRDLYVLEEKYRRGILLTTKKAYVNFVSAKTERISFSEREEGPK